MFLCCLLIGTNIYPSTSASSPSARSLRMFWDLSAGLLLCLLLLVLRRTMDHKLNH